MKPNPQYVTSPGQFMHQNPVQVHAPVSCIWEEPDEVLPKEQHVSALRVRPADVWTCATFPQDNWLPTLVTVTGLPLT